MSAGGAAGTAGTIRRERSLLLVIDMQARLMPAIADGAAVVARAVFLAETARRLGVPVVATEQNPHGLGPTVAELAPHVVAPFGKRHFAATEEPGFLARLPAGRDTIVVAGAEAHVCVLQTVLGLAGRGYAVTVATDAIGSRHPTDRDAAIARMSAHGAEMVTAEMVAFEWLVSADDPAFREIIGLVRRL